MYTTMHQTAESLLSMLKGDNFPQDGSYHKRQKTTSLYIEYHEPAVGELRTLILKVSWDLYVDIPNEDGALGELRPIIYKLTRRYKVRHWQPKAVKFKRFQHYLLKRAKRVRRVA
jgi:hypothetical protein